jgi:hypothetical protein
MRWAARRNRAELPPLPAPPAALRCKAIAGLPGAARLFR